MGNVQSLLSFGAMLILALSSLNFSGAVLSNSTTEIENKVVLTAFSLADDLIEEMKVRAFDAATVNFPTTNVASLTSAGSLGPAGWEEYPNFNDIDDFDWFYDHPMNVSAPHAENYNVRCRVRYVDANNPDQVVSTQTFYKKATVTVSSPYMKNPISLSFIFTLK
jgi:hypothetical protein